MLSKGRCHHTPFLTGERPSKWVGPYPSPSSSFYSDHDEEVASLASAAGGFGTKVPTPRLPAKDWKTKGSPRASPKLKRKGKKDDG